MATWESNPSGPGAHQAGAAHADPVDVEVEVARQTKRAVAGTPLRDSRYAAILLFVYVVVCFILMASPGWYSVSYRADGQEKCRLALRECTLAACRQEIAFTGPAGEGGQSCAAWHRALFMFLCAGIYTALFLLYLVGGFHEGRFKRWLNPEKKCCIDTGVHMGTSPCKVIPCCAERQLPHGALACGTPVFMTLGMVCFFAQDVKQFNGLPNVGYGPVFYLALLFTLGSFLLCGCMINDDVNGNKARLVNGMTKQARSEIMSKSGNGLQDPIDRMKIPTSAPFGYSFFTPPHNQTVTITTDDELRAALRNQDVRYRMNSSSRVVRTNIDKGWVVVSSFPDFFVLYSAKQP